jgi:hypothetical protein
MLSGDLKVEHCTARLDAWDRRDAIRASADEGEPKTHPPTPEGGALPLAGFGVSEDRGKSEMVGYPS